MTGIDKALFPFVPSTDKTAIGSEFHYPVEIEIRNPNIMRRQGLILCWRKNR